MEEEETKTSQSTGNESTSSGVRLTKKAVVVLNKLPQSKFSALRPPTPEQFYSEEESMSSSDSDVTERDSSDSELSLSNHKTKEKIKKRINLSHMSHVDPALTAATQHIGQRSVTNVKARRPKLPEPELSVDMSVIALKKPLRWERGKVLEIVTKEDGRVKYKVKFEERGKIVVSKHHVALDMRPCLAELYVGARVVVRCQINKFRFRPGILAELPSRSNCQMFLIFIDDHTPVYVHLPEFRLVCKQLDNPLKDVPESAHRTFMEQYLKSWPYPYRLQYREGQNINAELNGAQKECQVFTVNGSLVQVLFHENHFKEWIYRGSPRLERMSGILN